MRTVCSVLLAGVILLLFGCAKPVSPADNTYRKAEEMKMAERYSDALRLYKNFDFEIEGRIRASGYRNGKYIDSYLMGRLRPQGQNGYAETVTQLPTVSSTPSANDRLFTDIVFSSDKDRYLKDTKLAFPSISISFSYTPLTHPLFSGNAALTKGRFSKFSNHASGVFPRSGTRCFGQKDRSPLSGQTGARNN